LAAPQTLKTSHISQLAYSKRSINLLLHSFFATLRKSFNEAAVMKNYLHITLALCCAIPTQFVLSNDTLQDFRNVVRPPQWDAPVVAQPATTTKPKKNDQPTQQQCESCSPLCEDDNSDNGLLELGFLAAGIALTSPVWIPRSLIEDDTAHMAGYFPEHPYEQPRGYMIISPDTLPDNTWWLAHSHSLRSTVEYGTDFAEQELLGAKFLWEHSNRFGADARFVQLRDSTTQGDNDIWFGDANVLFRFAQHEKWQFRGGMGMNWFSENARADLGVNFTYGVDWYPVRPVIMSTELDLGTLGKGHLFHLQTTCGVNWHRLEGYIGYDYTDIGTAQYNFFLCGVRGWF
jgi:hypothetical protein